MKIIIDSKKHGRREVYFDSPDYDLIRSYKWHIVNLRSCLYVATTIKGKSIFMHRLILKPGKKIVDHQDRDGLNNRRSNIRICTMNQNQANRRMPKNNTSGFKGVFFNKFRNKYQAIVKVNKKRIYGGCFDCPRMAAIRYNELATIHHGRFAALNAI